MALWGSSLGTSVTLSLPEVCVFLQTALLSMKWKVASYLSVTRRWRKGVLAGKSVASHMSFAREYNGPTHPCGRWCYSLLGEWPQRVTALRCWLAADLPPCLPRPSVRWQVGYPHLSHCGLSTWTAVFIFSQCMCLILCWPCKGEGPGCVSQIFMMRLYLPLS